MGEEATFSVIQAKRDGLDAVIIIDTALRPDLLGQSFPWLLIITLPILRPNSSGLCDQAESDRLSDIEDQLLDSLDPNHYRYMGRMTWNKERDVFIYVDDPDNALEGIQSQLREIDPQNISITIESRYEPNWDTYRQFTVQSS